MRRGLWSLLLVAAPGLAGADEPAFVAELSCQPQPGSGRLICSVDYRSTSAGRIAWADALVIAAPPSLRPLRARAAATVEREGAAARASIALVPSAGGGGKITLRARAVVCSASGRGDAGACRPSERELSAELSLP